MNGGQTGQVFHHKKWVYEFFKQNGIIEVTQKLGSPCYIDERK
jgi:hypothetical protein